MLPISSRCLLTALSLTAIGLAASIRHNRLFLFNSSDTALSFLPLSHLPQQSAVSLSSPRPSASLKPPSLSAHTEPSPDNYPLPFTSPTLTLRVKRPYGKLLPHGPTISLLIYVEDQVDIEISKHGSERVYAYGWALVQDGVQVFFNNGWEMTLGHMKDAIRGTREMMMDVSFRELGTRDVHVEVWEGEKMLGIVDVGIQIELSPGRTVVRRSSF